MDVLNIDLIAPENKIIIIDGKNIEFPGDMPLKKQLELIDIAQRLEKGKDVKVFNDALKIVYDLTVAKEVDFEQFSNLMTMRKLTALIKFLFGVEDGGVKKNH